MTYPEEFRFLGYNSLEDPQYEPGYPINAFILPYQRKEFYESSSFGPEGLSFWNNLWDQAAEALAEARKITMIGYSMPVADCRARDLLFSRGNRSAIVTVCCGGDSERVCRTFCDHGFASVRSAKAQSFGEFVQENASIQ